MPQTETTPFYPRSPYGVSKVFAHYITVNYRESYNLFAVSGMLFNHESPRRGLEFVTRKVTDLVARIKLGLADTLPIGNLDAHRDWGFAGRLRSRDVADAAAGQARRLRDCHRHQPFRSGARSRSRSPASASTGRSTCSRDPALLRPAEVDHLLGDARRRGPSSAGRRAVNFKQLIEMMVDADLERLSSIARRGAGGHAVSADALASRSTPAIARCSTAFSPRRRRIGVIGLGYVGLPLAVEFARSGFDVTGFDVDEAKIADINAGRSYIPDVLAADLPAAVERKEAARDRRHVAARLDGRHRHLRADAAPEDQGSRPLLRREGRRGGRRDAAPRPARHPGVDDVSRHDRRGRPADARSEGAAGRTSTSSSPFRPSASIRGTRSFTTRTIPKVVGGRRAARAPSSHRALYRRWCRRSCRSVRPASPRW